jgi:mono/diheme cytochrome c family protein
MRKKTLLAELCALSCVLIGCAGAATAPVVEHDNSSETVHLPPVPTLAAADIATGETMYQQHCASCHGKALEGQPNWKQPLPNGKYPAPPHDNSGHTWHHNDELLLAITLNGGNGQGDMSHGDMPAFKALLSEVQARQILAFIKSRWGTQQREYQWERTHTGN